MKKANDKNSPSLEGDLKKEIRMTKVKRAVLSTVAAAGILSVGLVAPNALGALGPFIKKYQRQKQYEAKGAFSRLLKAGLLVMEKNERGSFARLSPTGEHYMARLKLLEYQIKKPKKWDEKWRIVIFDISEKRKRLRDQVRNILSCLGFVRLQDSVWVYPYNCEELVILIKTEFKIGKEVLYLIVDRIENDKSLRLQFDLKRK